MIPSIETIVEGLLDGTYTKQQAIGWLHQHAEDAGAELRDSFAAAALSGLASVPANTEIVEVAAVDAKAAYAYADAMLVERVK